MEPQAYLFTLSAFAQISGTIFAILLGFTIFLLNQKEDLDPIAFLLLVVGIFSSIIACGISVHGLASYTPEAAESRALIVMVEVFMFITIIAVAILAVFAIQEMVHRVKVKEKRKGWGR